MVTKSGFEFELDEEVLDDYELIETMHKIDKGQNGYLVELAEKMLGKEQLGKLKEHCKKPNGKVSAIKMFDEIAEIFDLSQELKN